MRSKTSRLIRHTKGWVEPRSVLEVILEPLESIMDMMDIVERYELGDEAKMMAKISLVIEACQRFYAIGGSTLGDIGFDAKLAEVLKQMGLEE